MHERDRIDVEVTVLAFVQSLFTICFVLYGIGKGDYVGLYRAIMGHLDLKILGGGKILFGWV